MSSIHSNLKDFLLWYSLLSFCCQCWDFELPYWRFRSKPLSRFCIRSYPFTFSCTIQQDILDPPEDCFRLRMVITLLETCGQFFDRGSSKRRLDRFLLYFQRYVLSKGVIPLDVEFDLQVVQQWTNLLSYRFPWYYTAAFAFVTQFVLLLTIS